MSGSTSFGVSPREPPLLYCPRLNCTLLDRARRSKIEARAPNEEDHSQIGKADEEDRFCKVAACPKVYNSAADSIIQIENLYQAVFVGPEINCPRVSMCPIEPFLPNSHGPPRNFSPVDFPQL